jgi:antitoxin component YwqK of YwqJK toxin-antitoxin module
MKKLILTIFILFTFTACDTDSVDNENNETKAVEKNNGINKDTALDNSDTDKIQLEQIVFNDNSIFNSGQRILLDELLFIDNQDYNKYKLNFKIDNKTIASHSIYTKIDKDTNKTQYISTIIPSLEEFKVSIYLSFYDDNNLTNETKLTDIKVLPSNNIKTNEIPFGISSLSFFENLHLLQSINYNSLSNLSMQTDDISIFNEELDKLKKDIENSSSFIKNIENVIEDDTFEIYIGTNEFDNNDIFLNKETIINLDSIYHSYFFNNKIESIKELMKNNSSLDKAIKENIKFLKNGLSKEPIKEYRKMSERMRDITTSLSSDLDSTSIVLAITIKNTINSLILEQSIHNMNKDNQILTSHVYELLGDYVHNLQKKIQKIQKEIRNDNNKFDSILSNIITSEMDSSNTFVESFIQLTSKIEEHIPNIDFKLLTINQYEIINGESVKKIDIDKEFETTESIKEESNSNDSVDNKNTPPLKQDNKNDVIVLENIKKEKNDKCILQKVKRDIIMVLDEDNVLVEKEVISNIGWEGLLCNNKRDGAWKEYRKAFEKNSEDSFIFEYQYIEYSQGVEDGKYLRYNNKDLIESGQYNQGKKSSKWNYYQYKITDNSLYLYQSIYYKNDKKNGEYIKYNGNGDMQKRMYYQNDILHGEYIEYETSKDRAGDKRYLYTYVNGKKTGLYSSYFEKNRTHNSTYYTGQLIDGKRDGIWTVYYKKEIREIITYKENNYHGLYDSHLDENFHSGKRGNYISVYSTDSEIWETKKDGNWLLYGYGHLIENITYINGLKHGKYTNWYYQDNEVIQYEGVYTKDKKSGVWKEYSTKGKLVKSITYNEIGKKEGLETIYQDEEIDITTNYKNGFKHGAYSSYYKNDNSGWVGEYSNGFQIGIWKFFSEGELIRTESHDF